ncbi:endolytic transglycosylase MltG [Candidatus Parcubacteria bacterium]|nr:endolytic transglycosylase MltG [Candidatus Parcubacteria bacterium]
MKKLIFIIIPLALIALCGFYFVYNYNICANNIGNSEDVIFKVASGESVKQIAENLFEKDLIRSKFYFLLYVKNQDKENALQAGEYNLNSLISIKDVVLALASGRALSKERDIKIIEGWRLTDIGEYLEKENISTKQKFLSLTESAFDWQFDFEKPKILNEIPNNASLEGFLFPDTYRIYNDDNETIVIKKMINNFAGKFTAEMVEDVAKQGRDIFEIVTMASIIEKEVRGYEDMRVVSGLFWNRIKNRQGLESCATLAYILGIDKPVYSLDDTKIKSDYNTYQNLGLPPGPICNPGLNAIRAAIYPVDTEYNYFLSRSDNGKTVFSKTYQEHLLNKAKYLR